MLQSLIQYNNRIKGRRKYGLLTTVILTVNTISSEICFFAVPLIHKLFLVTTSQSRTALSIDNKKARRFKRNLKQETNFKMYVLHVAYKYCYFTAYVSKKCVKYRVNFAKVTRRS